MDLTKIDKPFGELDRETKIALFSAWVDGVQITCNGLVDNPSWRQGYTYCVAVTKPSIDWDHVAPQFKWMATEHGGGTWLHENEPECAFNGWASYGHYLPADFFASFTPGTCDWRDSLVQRPE